jgi:hypothetical protein
MRSIGALAIRGKVERSGKCGATLSPGDCAYVFRGRYCNGAAFFPTPLPWGAWFIIAFVWIMFIDAL